MPCVLDSSTDVFIPRSLPVVASRSIFFWIYTLYPARDLPENPNSNPTIDSSTQSSPPLSNCQFNILPCRIAPFVALPGRLHNENTLKAFWSNSKSCQLPTFMCNKLPERKLYSLNAIIYSFRYCVWKTREILKLVITVILSISIQPVYSGHEFIF